MNRIATNTAVIAGTAVLLMPNLAAAHAGHEHGGLLLGLLHPWVGLDHLLAMAGVGLWAAQQSTARAALKLAAVFVAALLVGFLLGLGQTPLPVIELGSVGSVLLVGGIVASGRQLPPTACCAIAALFALCHGHAHGAEMLPGVSAFGFGAGFLAASVSLVGAGAALARCCRSRPALPLVRSAGVAIAAGGIVLIVVG